MVSCSGAAVCFREYDPFVTFVWCTKMLPVRTQVNRAVIRASQTNHWLCMVVCVALYVCIKIVATKKLSSTTLIEVAARNC